MDDDDDDEDAMVVDHQSRMMIQRMDIIHIYFLLSNENADRNRLEPEI
jgi:hypothetical protein